MCNPNYFASSHVSGLEKQGQGGGGFGSFFDCELFSVLSTRQDHNSSRPSLTRTVFGGRRNQQQQKKGPETRINLPVTLKDLYLGANLEVRASLALFLLSSVTHSVSLASLLPY